MLSISLYSLTTIALQPSTTEVQPLPGTVVPLTQSLTPLVQPPHSPVTVIQPTQSLIQSSSSVTQPQHSLTPVLQTLQSSSSVTQSAQPQHSLTPVLQPLQSSGSTSQSPQPQITYPVFPPSFLYEVKTQSNSSRTNFAVNLVCRLFDEETRANSNTGGKCGKRQLNPSLIKEVKTACFQVFPLENGEMELIAWKKCHQAINESCRRLKRKK